MSILRHSLTFVVAIGATTAFHSGDALAQAVPAFSGADTAWIIMATALVLFMTMPGLALFYGGLVRARSVLSVLMHCAAICCLISVLWLAAGYSLAFGDGGRQSGCGRVREQAIDAVFGNGQLGVVIVVSMNPHAVGKGCEARRSLDAGAKDCGIRGDEASPAPGAPQCPWPTRCRSILVEAT